MWTLANHPRVPDHIRNEVARWGMCRDEFTEGNGWQDQLYVREARRMVSDYVMTEHHCQGDDVAEDPIGLGAYGMDSHNTQRYVNAEGEVRNEGDVEVGRILALSDQLSFDRAQGEGVLEPARARLPVGVAHGLRLDPHGAGVHGPGAVGGNGGSPRHRRERGRAEDRLRQTASTVARR